MHLDPEAVSALLAAAPELEPLTRLGPPRKMRAREPGFACLVKIVVEQAVSQASAQAVWSRLCLTLGEVTFESVRGASASTLCAAGLSKGKVSCIQGLAAAVQEGRLDIPGLASASDPSVRASLCALRGIGRWTADVYLLLALRRPDVWPAHDLALQEALRTTFGLAARPSAREADGMGEALRPYRSTAALLLWEGYTRLSPRPTTRRRPSR